MIIKILLIGFAAGILTGFFGIGGGIIIIPLLVILMGFSQKMAQGTALLAFLPPVGLLATIVYWKAGNVNFKVAILIALGILLGSWFGATFVHQIPDHITRRAFAILLILVAVKMWVAK